MPPEMLVLNSSLGQVAQFGLSIGSQNAKVTDLLSSQGT